MLAKHSQYVGRGREVRNQCSDLGRTLLDPVLDRAEVISTSCSWRAPVKGLVLGEALLSGIGDIHADEGLRATPPPSGERFTRGRAGASSTG